VGILLTNWAIWGYWEILFFVNFWQKLKKSLQDRANLKTGLSLQRSIQVLTPIDCLCWLPPPLISLAVAVSSNRLVLEAWRLFDALPTIFKHAIFPTNQSFCPSRQNVFLQTTFV
jgi:hypothetical protein